jgi:mannose/fructose/N-acetylgalactosamine-specific phosphotransferase system component IID|tara:strand:- start:307 stop:723 length:417 start_codon:yes stop_codon:yes gene_type:complete
MKTPVSVLLTAIAYWVGIYVMTAIPTLTSNYLLNITWMTIVIPNMLRLMVSSIPRLAVDRVFFMASTLIAFVLTFILNKVFSDTKEAIEDSTVDNSKKLKMSALLVGTFTAGALATYFMGIDTSIYSNMGWENQGLTM